MKDGLMQSFGVPLVKLGYDIVPIPEYSKRPDGEWDRSSVPVTTLAMAVAWASNGKARYGSGVVCGTWPHFVAGVDGDIYHKRVADDIQTWLELRAGYAPVRVGQAPKRLLVYRMDGPRAKRKSAQYKDADGNINAIEILGAGQQFVAFGLHPVTRKEYYYTDGPDLTQVPPEQLEILSDDDVTALFDYFEQLAEAQGWERVANRTGGGSVKKSSVAPKTFEDLPDNTPIPEPFGLSKNAIASILINLDPDMSYDDWVQVLMGVHHETGGTEDGFEAVDEWSSKGAKYDADTMRKQWDSLRSAEDLGGRATTIRKIVAMSSCAVLEGALRRYYYMLDGDKVIDSKNPFEQEYHRYSGFRTATANQQIPVFKTKNKVEVLTFQPLASEWLQSPYRRDVITAVYMPGKPMIVEQEGRQYFNIMHMPSFPKTRAENKLKVFVEHMQYLIPDDEDREWFLSWMALNLQRPMVRSKVTPLHVSIAHGTGRGWVVEVMAALLGQHNCTTTKMQHLAGEGSAGAFNDYLDRSVLCSIAEVREAGGRYAVSDKVRDILTEDHLEVNRKYGKKGMTRIYTNFFFMSNHPDALVLTAEDRRIYVISGPDEVKSGEYYDRLYTWKDDSEAMAQLYCWLMRRDISGVNFKVARLNAAKQRMIGCSQTETEVLFLEFMQNRPSDAMSFKQIEAHMVELSGAGEFDAGLEEKQIVKLLQHHGKGQAARRRVEGVLVRPWLFKDEKQFPGDGIKNEILKAKDVCGTI